MSSTMRNAIQRRNHRERAQPASRAKWGLLEKHSDYSLRAADHKKKRKHLKVLREKARDRNPDEFTFGMMSTRTKAGVKIGDRGNKALSHEVVQLLKTQDAGYLRTVLQRTRLERARIEGALRVGDDGVEALGFDGNAKKVVFVETVEDRDAYKVEEEESEDDESEDIWLSEEDDDVPSKTPESKARKQELRTLEALKKREEELITASRELELQRAKMSNSIGGVNKKGVKFKVRERKR
ncbi:U3 small nucleolar RNA-associated protein 11 [Microthyrium microscopicum]|uniref:U3 small nucleolar RNA-associated protein 11 n=1 Tax=Microthyrium microscopicum TaxID=703497 RepID=A0A6A6U176_9PEZI|nr:U3 small nucleolar RNA-associated protein 11 [Microthyrium microscopicum]